MQENKDILTREFAVKRKRQVDDVSYDLFLEIKPNTERYSGKCRIKFFLKEKDDGILLDSISDVKKVLVNGKEAKFEKKEFSLGINEGLINNSENEIEVEYESAYDHTGAGLHKFTDPEDGNEYIYTHFEPYDAHRVFPCFDQPDLKATLDLSVEIPKKWVAISNEISEGEKEKDDRKIVKFKKTKKISTYLFEVCVGNYESIENSHNGLPLKIYFRKSLKNYVPHQEMFKLTKQGLDFYSKFFDYDYPFSKYDQIFVPEFNFGAMEQPGAVTFTERYLLRRKSTRTERARLANTLLHEMAHMWFGDLVTMKWWDDLWLNESFADFISYFAMTKATEFKDAWEDFYARKSWAYFEDQLTTTHPIAADASDTDVAFSNFDGISYAKGASVLKQLMFYIGEENFQKGLISYFRQYQWNNTELSDFLKCLEKSSSMKLEEWFDMWIKTTGVNSIKPKLEIDENGIANITIVQSPSKRNNLLRKHKTKVALFSKDNKINVKEASYEGHETKINGFGIPKEDLAFVHLNNEDWDYVKDFFDEDSLDYLLNNISSIKDSMTRQMILGSLWQMVRDSELDPKIFLDLIFKSIREEDNLLALERSLLRIRATVINYLGEKSYKEYCNKFFDLALEMLNSSANSDMKNVWFNLLLFSAPGADKNKIEHVAQIFEEKKKFGNFELDQDKKWDSIIKLSSVDHPKSEEFLESEIKKDKSDRGQKKAAAAETSKLKNKKKSWEMFVSGEGKSLDYLRDAMSGFYWRHQKEDLREYIELFFEKIKHVFDKHDKYYSKSFFESLFPSLYAEEEILEKVKGYFSEFGDFNKLLKKHMQEGIDEMEKALKIKNKYGEI